MFACGMIQLIQHQLGVGIQLQRRAAEYNQIRSIPICPAADTGEAINFRQRIGGTLRIVVEMKHFMRHPTHAHAAGQLGHGVGGNRASFRKLALRHQRTDVQYTGILLPRVFGNGIGGVADRVGEVAAGVSGTGFGQRIRGTRGEGEWEQSDGK